MLLAEPVGLRWAKIRAQPRRPHERPPRLGGGTTVIHTGGMFRSNTMRMECACNGLRHHSAIGLSLKRDPRRLFNDEPQQRAPLPIAYFFFLGSSSGLT